MRSGNVICFMTKTSVASQSLKIPRMITVEFYPRVALKAPRRDCAAAALLVRIFLMEKKSFIRSSRKRFVMQKILLRLEFQKRFGYHDWI